MKLEPRLLGRGLAAAETANRKTANLKVLSRQVTPGRLVHTLDATYYVKSASTTANGNQFVLTNFGGQRNLTASELSDIYMPKGVARLAFMRLAYDSELDTFVKAAIQQAQLPVDKKQNWAKWLQGAIAPNILTSSEEAKDEVIRDVLTDLLFEDQILTTKFNFRTDGGDEAQQVTAFLKHAIRWKLDEANRILQKRYRKPSDVGFVPEMGTNSEGEEVNILENTADTRNELRMEESEVGYDAASIREGFHAWLQEVETDPKEVYAIITMFDVIVASEGASNLESGFEADWLKAVGLPGTGRDNPKSHANFKRTKRNMYKLLDDFLEANQAEYAGNVIMKTYQKQKAKENRPHVSSLLASLIIAGEEPEPDKKMAAQAVQCMDCGFVGVQNQQGNCAKCNSQAVTRKVYVDRDLPASTASKKTAASGSWGSTPAPAVPMTTNQPAVGNQPVEDEQSLPPSTPIPGAPAVPTVQPIPPTPSTPGAPVPEQMKKTIQPEIPGQHMGNLREKIRQAAVRCPKCETPMKPSGTGGYVCGVCNAKMGRKTPASPLADRVRLARIQARMQKLVLEKKAKKVADRIPFDAPPPHHEEEVEKLYQEQQKHKASHDFKRMLRVASEEAPELSQALEQLGNSFGLLAESCDALNANLDLIPDAEESEVKKFARNLRRVAESAPEELANALNGLYSQLDAVAGDLEIVAENLGVVLEEPTEEEPKEEGQAKTDEGFREFINKQKESEGTAEPKEEEPKVESESSDEQL